MSRLIPARCLLLLFALSPFTGCASLQDSHYEHTQWLRTEKAWLSYWMCSEESLGHDYKKGWKSGYLNVLTGGSGAPPLVPPHEYWRPAQVMHHCDQKRMDWYAGFQDGAMMASLLPDTHYIKVWNPPPTGVCEIPQSTACEVSATRTLVPPSETPNLSPMPMPESVEDSLPPMGTELPVPGEIPPAPNEF